MAAATLSGLLRLAKTSLQIGPWNSSDANAGINEFAVSVWFRLAESVSDSLSLYFYLYLYLYLLGLVCLGVCLFFFVV